MKSLLYRTVPILYRLCTGTGCTGCTGLYRPSGEGLGTTGTVDPGAAEPGNRSGGGGNQIAPKGPSGAYLAALVQVRADYAALALEARREGDNRRADWYTKERDRLARIAITVEARSR